MLLERQFVSAEDLDRALELQKERGEKIGKILIDGGYCSARDVMATLSDQLRLPLITIDGPPAISPETEKLSARFLRQFRCLPIALQDSSVTLAMADPLDFETLAAVRTFTGLRVDPVLATEQEIIDAVDRFYGEAERTAMPEFGDGQAAEDLEHLRDMASEAPVIRLVNAMVAQAVEKRASDIHIEPFEKEFRIRYRIDGVLYPQDNPPKELKAAIISRVKLMAKLNIAERRLPQDGRIKIKTLGREVDLRRRLLRLEAPRL
jgi:general secretion pathway protein E